LPALPVRTPKARLFRIGRRPDPWAAPDWSRIGADKSFGNRFDDPEGEYRVLYAASSRLTCFIECLACFRPDLKLLAALKEISGTAETARFNVQDWVKSRAMGSALIEGEFADIYASEWVAMLRKELASNVTALGIVEFDLSALQAPTPRRLTQLVSRVVHSRGLSGVVYCSRFGTELENWAIFEPWTLRLAKFSPFSADDLDLHEAVRRLGIPVVMA
jgi:RES domain